MDSSESPVYGGQEGAAYNGHFGSVCYHPLFVFSPFGDWSRERAQRPRLEGAAGGAAARRPECGGTSLPEVDRRADAALARPEVYEFLEQQGFLYAIRLAGAGAVNGWFSP